MTNDSIQRFLTELYDQVNETKEGVSLSKVNCCGQFYIFSIDNKSDPMFCSFCGRIIDKNL